MHTHSSQLPPLDDAKKRTAVYFFHCQSAMDARREKFKMMRQKLQDKQKRIDELMGSEDTPGTCTPDPNPTTIYSKILYLPSYSCMNYVVACLHAHARPH